MKKIFFLIVILLTCPFTFAGFNSILSLFLVGVGGLSSIPEGGRQNHKTAGAVYLTRLINTARQNDDTTKANKLSVKRDTYLGGNGINPYTAGAVYLTPLIQTAHQNGNTTKANKLSAKRDTYLNKANGS